MNHVSLCGLEVASKFSPLSDATHTADMNNLIVQHTQTHTDVSYSHVCRLRSEHSEPAMLWFHSACLKICFWQKIQIIRWSSDIQRRLSQSGGFKLQIKTCSSCPVMPLSFLWDLQSLVACLTDTVLFALPCRFTSEWLFQGSCGRLPPTRCRPTSCTTKPQYLYSLFFLLLCTPSTPPKGGQSLSFWTNQGYLWVTICPSSFTSFATEKAVLKVSLFISVLLYLLAEYLWFEV